MLRIPKCKRLEWVKKMRNTHLMWPKMSLSAMIKNHLPLSGGKFRNQSKQRVRFYDWAPKLHIKAKRCRKGEIKFE